VKTEGKIAGLAEASTSDKKTGSETGRAVAEVTRLEAGHVAASSSPAPKTTSEGVDPDVRNRYAAGDSAEADENTETEAPSGSGQWAMSGEKGWAFLVNEVMSKVKELAGEGGEKSGGRRRKKVVVRALGEKVDGEDSDGSIWTEVMEHGLGGFDFKKASEGGAESSSDTSGSYSDGRPRVLGSGIGTVKEDGTTDVIPTGADVRKRFDDFFENGKELLDEKGRPSRWKAEVQEFVEKGGYENGAAAIQAKRQETRWKGTREFLARWGRENENGNGASDGAGVNGMQASASGRGKVGVTENGRYVKVFDTGIGHRGERRGEEVFETGQRENNSNGKSEWGSGLREKVDQYRTRFGEAQSETAKYKQEERGPSPSAVLERTESESMATNSVSSQMQSETEPKQATELGRTDGELKGRVNPVLLLLVAIAAALLLAWGHIQAVKVGTMPLS
jgi:hypothetical protein